MERPQRFLGAMARNFPPGHVGVIVFWPLLQTQGANVLEDNTGRNYNAETAQHTPFADTNSACLKC